MGHECHKKLGIERLKCAVVTVSDSRTTETDSSGKIIKEYLTKNEHEVMFYKIVRDDEKELKDIMNELLSKDIDVMITNGGTGISKRDITIEVVSKFISKELVGFGELFRYLSYREIGTPAILSRAMAGVYKDKLILSVPGSENAVTLAMEKIIIPELGHMLWEIRR